MIEKERQRLRARWKEVWSHAPPIASHLPRLAPHRHARFSLGSTTESYPCGDGEVREAISRWEALVEQLLGSNGSLLVITVDWSDQGPPGPRESPKGLQPVLPNYSYWQTVPYDAAMDYWLPLYVSEVIWRPGALNALFEQIASDGNDGVLITNADLGWIIAPAWNHTDVYAPSRDCRESLARKHADWLPDT